MNNVVRISCAMLAAFSVAGTYAQYEKPIGLSLRGGIVIVTNGTAKRVEGQNWFGVGGDYKLRDLSFGNQKPGHSASLQLSVDYYGKGSFSNVPVTVSYIGRANQLYYGLGAGIGFTRVPGRNGSSGDEDFTFTLCAGYDIERGGTPIFFEAKYFGSNESRLNAFGLYAGIRF
jgi:hypothetical protein